VSKDSKEWFEVQVPDISAGGLQLVTDRVFEPDEILCIDLNIDPLMSGNPNNFVLKAKLIVKRLISSRADSHTYSAAFSDISNEDKVRLDILVNWTMENFGSSGMKEE